MVLKWNVSNNIIHSKILFTCKIIEEKLKVNGIRCYWVNVPVSFVRGNLDGRLFIVLNFFIEFGFSNGPLSISATLEDQAAQSNIRLFCTSSQVLTIDSQDNEEDDSSDDDEDHSSEDDKITLKMEKTEKRMIYHSRWWVHRSSGF